MMTRIRSPGDAPMSIRHRHRLTETPAPAFAQLEHHRTALIGHCYRMLGSAVDAATGKRRQRPVDLVPPASVLPALELTERGREHWVEPVPAPWALMVRS